MKKIGFLLAVLVLSAAATWPVWAGEQARVVVFGVDTGAFPRVSAWVDVLDTRGKFIGGIQPADVTVSEDGKPRALVSWDERHPGAQVVVAIEAGRPLGVRDDLGVSRYEYIYNQLHSWAARPHGVSYDLSLVTSDGTQSAHLADFAPFLQVLEGYKPTTTENKTGLKALADGLRLAGDPTPRPGMGRVLLWITPLPTRQALQDLPQYLSLAQKARVRVYIWLVGPPALQHDEAVKPMREFAQATSGRLYFFSGAETLPLVDDLVRPLTRIYHLTYASEAVRGEEHTLKLTLKTPQGETLTTEAVHFRFALQPPNVVILNPPEQVVRVLPSGETNPAKRTPASLEVHIGVTFPDEHPRALTHVALLVDGQTGDVRDAPPYDVLQWDLRQYLHGGAHTLQVEAKDVYGFTVRSQPVTVQVSVPQPKVGVTTWLAAHRTPLTVGIVVLAGLVLLSVLWLGGGKRPRRRSLPPEAALAGEGGAHEHGWLGWLPRRSRKAPSPADGQALAYLVPLAATDAETGAHTVLKLRAVEIALGSDPAQADLIIDDPSVEPLHARLWRTSEGVFFVADQRSAAGTWLNYAPVSAEGAQLQEGDLVHFGRVGFRFRLKIDEAAQVTIMPASPSDDED